MEKPMFHKKEHVIIEETFRATLRVSSTDFRIKCEASDKKRETERKETVRTSKIKESLRARERERQRNFFLIFYIRGLTSVSQVTFLFFVFFN